MIHLLIPIGHKSAINMFTQRYLETNYTLISKYDIYIY